MIPRIRFAQLPTPIENMPRMEEALHGPHLLVKRDDQTGLAFGGNKTRKLEFLVAEARAEGADTLITAGAVQSNHCRQTAAAAAKFGFDCILVLTGEAPAQVSANLLLDRLFGARIIWTEKSRREAALKETYEKTTSLGHKPYLVPYGGSNPTGALGYAFAMQEFIDQGVNANWILFASSSGGTQAGLVLGARRFGYSGRLLGISVDEPQDILQEKVARLASDASERLGPRMNISADEVQVNANYAAPGYGILTNVEHEAIRIFAKYEGLLLDPVYTGRAGAALIDLVHKGFFRKDETVLFWHTGGGPALFAAQYQGDLTE